MKTKTLFGVLILILFTMTLHAQSLYFNSSEPGGDGSDPNVLFCDDFEKDGNGNTPGIWYLAAQNASLANKGWYGTHTPNVPGAVACGSAGYNGSNCAADMGHHPGATMTASFNCGQTTITLNSTADLPSNTGADIITSTPWRIADANGYGEAITWTGKTVTQLTGVQVGPQFGGACQGPIAKGGWVGLEGSVNIAEHAFNPSAGNISELYMRWYYKASTGYVWGAEKGITINNGALGDGGIHFGGFAFRGCGSLPDTIAFIDFASPGYKGNQCQTTNISNISILSGHWYFFEMHIKLNTFGLNDGVAEIWANDCGTSNSGQNCGSAPVLRLQKTDVNWNRSSSSDYITRLWWEGWANAASCCGNEYLDNIKVSKVGPLGFSPITTSVAKSIDELNTRVYPNPATDNLTLSLPSVTLKTEITIYNTLGEKMVESTTSIEKTELDISKLVSGVYMLEAKQGNKIIRQKFIKQ